MSRIAAFRAVVTAGDMPTAMARALGCPALLWAEAEPGLRAWIASRPAEEQAGLTDWLDQLRALGTALEANARDWPAGLGPTESLAEQVRSGAISLPMALAAAPDLVDCLSPVHVRVVADRLRLQALNGEWEAAVPAFRILLAATDAMQDEPGAAEMREAAGIDWIETVCAACLAVPDGRLFHDAVRRGEALATQARRRGLAMHRLGVLHLDPWISGRVPEGFAAAIAAWRQRLLHVHGPLVASDPAASMPEPAQALDRAVHWLRAALPHREGEPRGLTLKALAEALVWRAIAGGPAEDAAARAAAEEALGLLPAARHAVHLRTLRGLLARLGAPAAEAGARSAGELLWLDFPDAARRYGPVAARERYVSQALDLLGVDPHAALALMLRLWPHLEAAGDEDGRLTALQVLARALSQVVEAKRLLQEAGEDPGQLAAALATAAEQGEWSAGREAAARAGVAVALTALDREAEGLALVREAIGMAGEAAPDLLGPLAALEGQLSVGEAVNAYRAGQWEDATGLYISAMVRFADTGLPESAMDALLRAENVTFGAPDRPLHALTAGLATHAAALAAGGAPRLGARLQTIWDRVIARIGEQSPLQVAHLALALQGAKGAAFAAMLQGSGYDWRRDAEATALLARIAGLRAAAPPAAPAAPDPLGDSLILVSHTGAETERADIDPIETLELRFDALLARRMATGEVTAETYVIGDALAQALGPRSALLSLHLGRSEDGRLAITTLLEAGETAAAARGVADLPAGLVAMEGRRHKVEMSFFAPVVASLRDALQEDPWPEPVSPAAAATLAEDHARLLGGGLAAQLAALRAAGRDHLCIHPHGPYHFHPLHLIGPAGRPLAEDWIVTTLPHPALLRAPDAAGAPARDLPLAALGLGFAGHAPHGLAPLPGAAEEARLVAGIMGGACWTDAEATPARFLEAVQGARRVHVATHGAHDVTAPAFQRLYLQPGAGSDGILHAHEITGLDLRGLDLVTLSACETALGRCDVADTLRGLPAAMFIAGAATIISTLWPVADAPARRFFETLYAAIAQGAGKLDAFRAAQVATRAAHPEWRDWGAFHFAGRW